MSSPQYDGWSKYGIGQVQDTLPVALAAGKSVNNLVQVRLPEHCQIASVEAHFDTIAGGATTATLSIWRDSTGDVAFVTGTPTAATQTIETGITTATDGTVAWSVFRDHHSEPGGTGAFTGSTTALSTLVNATASQPLTGARYVDLWFHINLNAGTANLNALFVDWRA